jgi:hypothetical protein
MKDVIAAYAVNTFQLAKKLGLQQVNHQDVLSMVNLPINQ